MSDLENLESLKNLLHLILSNGSQNSANLSSTAKRSEVDEQQVNEATTMNNFLLSDTARSSIKSNNSPIRSISPIASNCTETLCNDSRTPTLKEMADMDGEFLNDPCTFFPLHFLNKDDLSFDVVTPKTPSPTLSDCSKFSHCPSVSSLSGNFPTIEAFEADKPMHDLSNSKKCELLPTTTLDMNKYIYFNATDYGLDSEDQLQILLPQTPIDDSKTPILNMEVVQNVSETETSSALEKKISNSLLDEDVLNLNEDSSTNLRFGDFEDILYENPSRDKYFARVASFDLDEDFDEKVNMSSIKELEDTLSDSCGKNIKFPGLIYCNPPKNFTTNAVSDIIKKSITKEEKIDALKKMHENLSEKKVQLVKNKIGMYDDIKAVKMQDEIDEIVNQMIEIEFELIDYGICV